jgi:CheY-like chemotaxis protein
MTDKSNELRKKILIVEDDDISRKAMSMHLRNYYQTDTAKNGEEAINLFSRNDYQLVLMDINLGIGKNGIEVMKEIRKTDKGATIPVIAITAYANFGDRESFLSAGFDNYISKPYLPDDLLRNIMDTISRMEY